MVQRGLGVVIRLAEWIRGTARYPHRMMGRQNPVPRSMRSHHRRRILVVAAHPDDEAIGLGSVLCRHAAKGDEVFLIFTTNGRGLGWFTRLGDQRVYVSKRRREALEAARLLDIPPEHVGFLGFPDGNLIQYIRPLGRDLETIYQSVRPSRVYVQGLEGGHVDHDVTSVVVQTVLAKMGFSHVWEWAEYNHQYDVSDPVIGFPEPTPGRTLRISHAESKKRLLAVYESQPIIGRVSDHDEVVRKAEPSVVVCETLRCYGLRGQLGRHLRRAGLVAPSRARMGSIRLSRP